MKYPAPKSVLVFVLITGITAAATVLVGQALLFPKELAEVPAPSPTPQEYRNEKFGYSLSLYPAGTVWEVTDHGGEVKWRGPDRINLHVYTFTGENEKQLQENYDKCRDYGGSTPKPGGRPVPLYQAVSGEGWQGELVLYQNTFNTSLCIKQGTTVFDFDYSTGGVDAPAMTEGQRKIFVDQIVPSIKFSS